VPGPACYGRGGEEPTVTDANVVLGALSGDTVLAGTLRLDAARAAQAIERVAQPLGLDLLQGAAGILRIVNTQMAVDLRLALQEQGQDPRKFALVAFGGAGPLHAATLAKSVGIPTVLVPAYPGLNCAMGMLQTRVRHSYLKSEVGVLSRFPRTDQRAVRRPRAAGAGEASEEGFARDAVKLTRLSTCATHQGYTCRSPVRATSPRTTRRAQAGLRHAARPGLWPVRPEGGGRDRHVPLQSDRRAAANCPSLCKATAASSAP
jgi:N-methylhydantoinase A